MDSENLAATAAAVGAVLGAVLGAALAWLGAYTNDRAKWRRERAARWDERRLTAFVEYAAAVKREVHLCNRIAKALQVGTMDVAALDIVEGEALLNAAEERRADAFEGLLLLADKKTIDAARAWHGSVWKLSERTVQGFETLDQDKFKKLFQATGVARDDFHQAARESLNVTGEFAGSLALEMPVATPVVESN
jgi:hypothetical protein